MYLVYYQLILVYQDTQEFATPDTHFEVRRSGAYSKKNNDLKNHLLTSAVWGILVKIKKAYPRVSTLYRIAYLPGIEALVVRIAQVAEVPHGIFLGLVAAGLEHVVDLLDVVHQGIVQRGFGLDDFSQFFNRILLDGDYFFCGVHILVDGFGYGVD